LVVLYPKRLSKNLFLGGRKIITLTGHAWPISQCLEIPKTNKSHSFHNNLKSYSPFSSENSKRCPMFGICQQSGDVHRSRIVSLQGSLSLSSIFNINRTASALQSLYLPCVILDLAQSVIIITTSLKFTSVPIKVIAFPFYITITIPHSQDDPKTRCPPFLSYADSSLRLLSPPQTWLPQRPRPSKSSTKMPSVRLHPPLIS
jgi:hypothetical protein